MSQIFDVRVLGFTLGYRRSPRSIRQNKQAILGFFVKLERLLREDLLALAVVVAGSAKKRFQKTA